MAYDPPLTPEQRRLIDRLKSKSAFAGSPWIDETTVWNSGAPYKTARPSINLTNADIPTPTVRNLMATRKFVANLVVEANATDKYDQSVKVNLIAVSLTSDDLTDLLAKAHGHLELVSDK